MTEVVEIIAKPNEKEILIKSREEVEMAILIERVDITAELMDENVILAKENEEVETTEPIEENVIELLRK